MGCHPEGMTGLGWALQVAVPGEGESCPCPIPQQEESTDRALYIQNERGPGKERQAVRLFLSPHHPCEYWPSGVGWGRVGGSSVSQAPPGCSGLGKGLRGHIQPLIEVSTLGSRGEPQLTGFCPETQGALRAQRAEEARSILPCRQNMSRLTPQTAPNPPPSLQIAQTAL